MPAREIPVSPWAPQAAERPGQPASALLPLSYPCLSSAYREFLLWVRLLRLPSVRDPVWEEAVAAGVAGRTA